MTEIQRRSGAPIYVRPAPPAQYLTADRHGRHLLLARAVKADKRGQLLMEWPEPIWDQQSGLWLLKVRILKPPAPAWRKYAIGAGIAMAVLAALGWLIWHALTALTSSALGVLLLAVLAGLALLVFRGRSTEVTVSTTTRVRVRR